MEANFTSLDSKQQVLGKQLFQHSVQTQKIISGRVKNNNKSKGDLNNQRFPWFLHRLEACGEMGEVQITVQQK